MDGTLENTEITPVAGPPDKKPSILGLETVSAGLGNKLFSPKEILGKDEGSIIKTPVIVSQKGLEFLGAHAGIIPKIDEGLAGLVPQGVLGDDSQADLDESTHIRYLSSGMSSDAFILEVGENKFVLKTKRKTEGRTAWQPYTREMLQAQTITRELGRVLGQEKVSLPEFMFASDEVVCTKLETGEQPKDLNELSAVSRVAKKAREYMNKKRQSEDLWKNVYLDISINQTPYGDEVVQVLQRDVLRRPDGTFVWIDPFSYGVSTEPAPDSRSWWKRVLAPKGKKYDYSG